MTFKVQDRITENSMTQSNHLATTAIYWNQHGWLKPQTRRQVIFEMSYKNTLIQMIV